MVTYYFLHKFTGTKTILYNGQASSRLSHEAEEEAAAFIVAYGSYLDIYKCLLFAGQMHSKLLIDKLVGVAKYDSQHKEAMKALQKAGILLLYEPVRTHSI